MTSYCSSVHIPSFMRALRCGLVEMVGDQRAIPFRFCALASLLLGNVAFLAVPRAPIFRSGVPAL